MRIPTKMNFNNEVYDTLCLFTINEANFLIIKKDNNIIEIDTTVDNDNLSFKLASPLKDSENTSEHILIDYLMETLKASINEEKITSDDELKKILTDINQYITNSDIGQILKSCNVEIKNGDFTQNIISLLEYFDKKLENNNILDFNILSNFLIGNANYLKYKNESNETKIVIDTPENREMVKNLESKKEENKIGNDSNEVKSEEENIEKTAVTNLSDENNNETIVNNPTDENILETTIPNLSEQNNQDNFVNNETVIENEQNDENNIFEPAQELTNNVDPINNLETTPEPISEEKNENKENENSEIVENNKDSNSKDKKKKKHNMVDILILLLIVGIICTIYLTYLVITVI